MELDSYIKKAQERFAEVEQEISNFSFGTDDQSEYEKLNREYRRLSDLKQAWEAFHKAQSELADNKEMLEMEDDEEFLEVIKSDIEDLETKVVELDRTVKTLILPPHPNQDKNIIVEIRPAAGGDEAGLFAGDMYRLYMRFAEAKKWKVEHLEHVENDLGGIKSTSFSLKGENVYKYMGRESGVHRVQRIPTTESGGRIHTSTITVAVLAEAEEVDLKINNEDLRFDVFRSSGPGGQCVNTTDSAVRVTHIPTGISVASQQEKSQHRNKEIAIRILRSRLLAIKQEEEDQKNAAERRSQVGTGDRSERIRTYNYPQNRVTDHRYGITRYDLTNIMEGDAEGLFQEIIALDAEQRLADELNK